MQCISPLKASHNKAGDITYNSRRAEPGLIGFQFECRKCLACRLNMAREKAIKAWHESKINPGIFLTLTYDEQHLESPRLIYPHFQNFMKSLRQSVTQHLIKPESDATDEEHDAYKEAIDKLYIPYIVCGEYGDKNKRPHWHALLFNYRPSDEKYKYTNEHKDKVYTSEKISQFWGKGSCEYGEISMDSAGYVARYAAKKLAHGRDQDHDYHPLFKYSQRRFVGRSWIERYYKHTFTQGHITLANGEKASVPRSYVDWAKEHKPDFWEHYVTKVRPNIIALAEEKKRKEESEFLSELMTYNGRAGYPLTRSQVEMTILKSKFKRLQEYLKL